MEARRHLDLKASRPIKSELQVDRLDCEAEGYRQAHEQPKTNQKTIRLELAIRSNTFARAKLLAEREERVRRATERLRIEKRLQSRSGRRFRRARWWRRRTGAVACVGRTA